MMPARRVLVVLGTILMAGTSAFAQTTPERRGFWASVQFGYGLLDKFSDQEPNDEQGTFALAFSLGGLGHVDNVLVTVQNRRYRVFDFGIAVTYR